MKAYIEPEIEVIPIGLLSALCTSGGENGGFNNKDEGKDSWQYGRAPHRTPAF